MYKAARTHAHSYFTRANVIVIIVEFERRSIKKEAGKQV